MINYTNKLLRSPEADPLAMPAGEVDTRFPRLAPDKIYRMVIRSPEVAAAKSNDQVNRLTFKLETTTEARDTEGGVLHAGFKFLHGINVTPSGERDANAVAKDCALLLKAVEGAATKTTARQLIDNPSIIADKVVDVKVGLQKAKDGFPESNRVTNFVIPT